MRKISSCDLLTPIALTLLDVEVVHSISSRVGINVMIAGNASVMVYLQLIDRPATKRMPEYLGGRDT